jgi:hypothetical protein
MTARLSTGLTNTLLSVSSFADIFANSVIDVYSGTQPGAADTAATGTLLCSVTNGGLAYTAETRATGTLTIAGSSGSINTVTVNSLDILGGAVTFTTDLTTTAALIVAQINANPKNRLFVASSVAAVITLTAVNGLGTSPNGWVVAYTATTMTATPANMAGGVNSANGLLFGSVAAGVLSKLASQTWQGTVLSTGTAGWFRLRESGDLGTSDSATACRYDGAIASSGSQMNLAVQTLTAGAPLIIPSGSITLATS